MSPTSYQAAPSRVRMNFLRNKKKASKVLILFERIGFGVTVF